MEPWSQSGYLVCIKNGSFSNPGRFYDNRTTSSGYVVLGKSDGHLFNYNFFSIMVVWVMNKRFNDDKRLKSPYGHPYFSVILYYLVSSRIHLTFAN